MKINNGYAEEIYSRIKEIVNEALAKGESADLVISIERIFLEMLIGSHPKRNDSEWLQGVNESINSLNRLLFSSNKVDDVVIHIKTAQDKIISSMVVEEKPKFLN